MVASDKNSGSTPLSLLQALVLPTIPIPCSHSAAPAWTPAYCYGASSGLSFCLVTFSQGLTVILKPCRLASKALLPGSPRHWVPVLTLPSLQRRRSTRGPVHGPSPWFYPCSGSVSLPFLPTHYCCFMKLQGQHPWQGSQDPNPSTPALLP